MPIDFDNTYSVNSVHGQNRGVQRCEGCADLAIEFEKFRIFLKPWKYTGIFLAQPSNERMLYDIKRYYEDQGKNTKLTLDL